ncbi:hypothetical protein Pmani_022767 [Petrolisthes manimaculis]|uniref:Uncharacterized protein n=1 Tax=Petrolisthes manimaculis TaxID=1843537 RepID=A0AAE1PCH9_9EUCA|nr:hypothetical protein Pmani_022767 [Petrolisthes manimaculis]
MEEVDDRAINFLRPDSHITNTQKEQQLTRTRQGGVYRRKGVEETLKGGKEGRKIERKEGRKEGRREGGKEREKH